MKKTSILFLLLIVSSMGFAQSKAEKLFRSKQWEELASMKSEAKRLSGKDLYRIGQACMHTNSDTAAIRMFNGAINKGYQKGDVYYNLGQSYNHNKEYNHAIQALDNALFLVPDRKPYLLEKAASWYSLEQPDSALSVYRYVQKLYPKNQFSAYMVCSVLHDMERYNKCLKCYYNSLHKFLDKNKYYRLSLESIARIEWYENNRYDKSEKAVVKLIKAYPKNYEYRMWLVQLQHIQNNFHEADSVNQIILAAYNTNALSSKYYKNGSYLIDAYNIAQFYVEVFQWFRPEKDNIYFTVYVLGQETNYLHKKLIVQKYDGCYTIFNDKTELSFDTYEELDYKSLKNTIAEFLLPKPENIEIKADSVNNE